MSARGGASFSPRESARSRIRSSIRSGADWAESLVRAQSPFAPVRWSRVSVPSSGDMAPLEGRSAPFAACGSWCTGSGYLGDPPSTHSGMNRSCCPTRPTSSIALCNLWAGRSSGEESASVPDFRCQRRGRSDPSGKRSLGPPGGARPGPGKAGSRDRPRCRIA